MRWLLLTAVLPTSPSGLRVRIWRALKGAGCASLRDGVYLLPAHAPTAPELWSIEAAIRDGGAQAHMLEVEARDAAQEQAFRALFDRAPAYADFLHSLKEVRKRLRGAEPAEQRKTLRQLDQQLRAIRQTDFFAGAGADKAAAGLETLRTEVERRLSPDEPSRGAGVVQRRDIAQFQGRTWATRKRPWVDRLATAWLVARHVDRAPRFVWLADPRRCPKSAVGYDFDGATFTHIGELVTFEVVARSFALDDEPALRRLGEIVHFIDVGGIPVDEAPGVEAVVRGLQAQHGDDDALLAAGLRLFDTLHAALRS